MTPIRPCPLQRQCASSVAGPTKQKIAWQPFSASLARERRMTPGNCFARYFSFRLVHAVSQCFTSKWRIQKPCSGHLTFENISKISFALNSVYFGFFFLAVASCCCNARKQTLSSSASPQTSLSCKYNSCKPSRASRPDAMLPLILSRSSKVVFNL